MSISILILTSELSNIGLDTPLASLPNTNISLSNFGHFSNGIESLNEVEIVYDKINYIMDDEGKDKLDRILKGVNKV